MHIIPTSTKNIKRLVNMLPYEDRFSRRPALLTVYKLPTLSPINILPIKRYGGMTYIVDPVGNDNGMCHVRSDKWADDERCLCYIETHGDIVGFVDDDAFQFVVKIDDLYYIKCFSSSWQDTDDGVDYSSIVEPLEIDYAFRLQSVSISVTGTQHVELDTGRGGLCAIPIRSTLSDLFTGNIKARCMGTVRNAGDMPWRIEQSFPGPLNITSIISVIKDINDANRKTSTEGFFTS